MKFLVLFLVTLSNPVFGKLMLYSDEVYLGCLDCSGVNSESVCNVVGRYGSSVSSTSIWNSVGRYGSSVSSKSPWNSVSSNGPKIIDQNGKYYGRFTINSSVGFDQSIHLSVLYHKVSGDLSRLQKIFCK